MEALGLIGVAVGMFSIWITWILANNAQQAQNEAKNTLSDIRAHVRLIDFNFGGNIASLLEVLRTQTDHTATLTKAVIRDRDEHAHSEKSPVHSELSALSV